MDFRECHPAKEAVMKLIERNTDVSPTDKIAADRRCDRAVADDLLRAYDEKGRRGAGVRLPPDYSKQGPYSLTHGDTYITITCNFSSDPKTSVNMPITRGARYYLDMDWSESRCVLRQEGGSFRKSVLQVLVEYSGPRWSADKCKTAAGQNPSSPGDRGSEHAESSAPFVVNIEQATAKRIVGKRAVVQSVGQSKRSNVIAQHDAIRPLKIMPLLGDGGNAGTEWTLSTVSILDCQPIMGGQMAA